MPVFHIRDPEALVSVAKVLSNKTRLKILTVLSQRGEMNITHIAQALEQTSANASAQIMALHNAGLLSVRYEAGKHGLQKLCSVEYTRIVVDLENVSKNFPTEHV